MKRSELRNIIEEEILRIIEGGQSAGKLEIAKINYNTAEKFMEQVGLLDQIDNFADKFSYAQKLANLGKTKRKDMPVIDDPDVKRFQSRLKHGTLDINEPFSPDTDPSDPWPKGLNGFDAKDFVQRGLKDGSKKDDVIGITIKKMPVGQLKPIQKQMYFDKSMYETAKSGVKNTLNWLGNKTFFITSADNFIIDGHHRWLSGIVLDPNLKVNTLSIDMPIKELLPMATAYGDAIGNKRNA